MIEILSAVLGFAAPFLPEALKYFNRKADNAHELAMLRLQGELADKQHAYRAGSSGLRTAGRTGEATVIHDKLTPWRIARAVDLLLVPTRIAAVSAQIYWATWHQVFRYQRGEQ